MDYHGNNYIYEKKITRKSKKNAIISMKKDIFETFEAVVVAVIIVVFIFTFIFKIVGVEGKSMLPTVHNDDKVVLTHMFYQPSRGDIIVINHHDFSVPIIKRVIAVGGEFININPNTGEVFINDEKLDEPYINNLTKLVWSEEVTYPHYVPEGYVFVMGDNRMDSTDSRKIGDVDIKQILGKAVFRIYPFDSIGIF